MISVLIPTADRLGPLHRALRSLSRQVFREFEVIVVNDGGRSPRSVVESWQGELAITLIDLASRRGVSCARNVAVEAAAGDCVAFLDDDDIYLPNHLWLAHRALSEEDVDVVYGGALVSHRWIEAMPRWGWPLPRKDYAFDDGYLRIANYIHTGSVVARNFAGTGVRFDPELSHCEDWDMWLALRLVLGYRFAYLGECTSVYHQLPHRRGAVSTAYLTSPTPFTRAHTLLYDRWAARGSLIEDYRNWFRQFDRLLDARIERGESIPGHIFDGALAMTYSQFANGSPAHTVSVDSLFTEAASPADMPTKSVR